MANSVSTDASAVFSPVPAKPDHPALEQRILAAWEQNGTFEHRRKLNEGGPAWSFVDGPITANNPMGVHHAWGRTLKDVYQRLYAMRGYDQRYQNGFDCQGLWVEVEVEKSLGLNSKPEIEAYGLDKFSRACRDRVAEYSEVQTRQSKRLGQWMDWDADYYTLSDTNISYIWTFLAECHRRDWLYQGHRPMTWCPRCGTSLSQHELIDSYKDVQHPSLHVRFPLVDRPGESIVVWTTTPWTLPANVAAAVKPDATYALIAHQSGDAGGIWVAEDRVTAIAGEDAEVVRTAPGSELVGLQYEAPFSHLPVVADLIAGTAPEGKTGTATGALHKVVAWDDVSMDDGTGIVHIAPGCGAEDYELGKEQGLAIIAPVDEAGHFFDGFGELCGLTTHDAAPVVTGDLKQREILVKAGTIDHRFPSCWRCGTELIFRLVDEWFISCEDIRQQMLDANQTVEWHPDFYGKRMDDWLRNMGDWCISRKRYWGLPLPFYPCDTCDELVVVESRAQLEELAVSGMDQLEELHRPWIDNVTIKCPKCASHLTRLTEVGDCWLDAGIIPFSTLGWKNPEHIAGGYSTGASEELATADLPSHEEWERWFPSEIVIEMREQIRLWFYSMLFMSVVLDGRAPYKRVLSYEKVQDETGRAMHKSWGNAIWFDDAVDEMGADVMRWLYCQQTPSQNLNFGYGPATDIKRRFLTLWNVYSFFVTYANLDGFRPSADSLDVGDLLNPAKLESRLDAWLAARTHQLVRESSDAFDRWDSPAYTRSVERYVDELSNWYVRRSRRRFWKAEEGEDDRQQAYQTLWGALVTLTRVIAPVMPFLADELWENLVAGVGNDALPTSVHLSSWPAHDEAASEHSLLSEVDAVQRIVALGRAARSASKLKLRQPLREVVVMRRSQRGQGTADLEALVAPHLDDVLAELSIKQVTYVDDPQGRWTEGLMPLLPKLGPKYGKDVANIRKAVAQGNVEMLDDGRAQVGEFVLEKDEYENRSESGEGWALGEDNEWVVAVSTDLDDELRLEGLSREVVRALQQLRKDSGLEISDRVMVEWSAEGDLAAAIEAHSSAIADEILATSFGRGTAGASTIEVEGETVTVSLTKA